MTLDVYIPPNRSQRLIDEELISLEKRALQLKTERNACAEISKLPEDVLGEIFTILANSCPLKSWFKINLVCRHWRETALETVALWTNPPTHHHELTLLTLERSKMADLCVNLGKGASLAITATILRHIGRIRSLSIIHHVDLLTQALVALKSSRHHVSRLKNLQVHFRAGLLQESSIALRQFDWEVFALPSLTHLSLQEVPLPSPISAQHLLQALRAMRNLKSLRLRSDIIAPHNPPLESNSLKVVQLPHLSSLQIWWRVTHRQVIYLLSRLQLPQLSHLDITCHSTEDMHGTDNDSDYSLFMCTALSTVSSGDFSACDTLVVCSDQWFELIPQRFCGGLEPMAKGLAINLCEYAGFNNSTQYFTLEVVAALGEQILSRLVKLELHDSQPPADDILRLFGRLPSLECIEVDPGLIDTLIMGLSIPPDHPPRTPLRMFPKLMEVVLPYLRSIYDPRTMQALCDSLKARYHFGAPIQKLKLGRACVPENSVLHSLGDIGVEIHVKPF